MFPFALITIQLSIFNYCDEQKIAFERKEYGRTFVVAIKWEHGRADFAMRAQREVNTFSLTQIRRAISNNERRLRKGQLDHRVIRAVNGLFAQAGKISVLGAGLEPACLSAYAPQTYVSAIPPPERSVS